MDIEENTQIEGQEEQQPVQLDKKWKHKPGAVVIVLVAIAALAFILWLIFSIWSLSAGDKNAQQTSNQPAPTAAEYVDLTIVPDRDSDVLGLRIDTVIGRFFTERNTGQTLYINDGDCIEECLDEWTPYLSKEPVVDGGDFGSLIREDTGEIQYTWKGKGLYTYQSDSQDSVLGDGHSGTWHIARP